MPLPLRPAAFLAVAVLAGCAPTQEWVNPAAPAAARDADMSGCDAAAWSYARQRSFLYGPGLYGPGLYGPIGGPWGGVRTSQANTLAALDRSRYFDECMRTRGYALEPVAPR